MTHKYCIITDYFMDMPEFKYVSFTNEFGNYPIIIKAVPNSICHRTLDFDAHYLAIL